MGRTQPSRGRPPSSQRKDTRAKHARITINKTIPALLAAYPRARSGVENAELIVAPEAPAPRSTTTTRKASVVVADDNEEEKDGGTTRPFKLRLVIADTLTAAAALRSHTTQHGKATIAKTKTKPKPKHAPRNIAVLNMASPLRAGGGVLNGATSQEEMLCLRTTLYPSLKDEFYRLPEIGAVWTSDVLVFRDEEGRDLGKGERWWVDVVSAGMLRFPDVDADDGEGLESKDESGKEEGSHSDQDSNEETIEDEFDLNPADSSSTNNKPSQSHGGKYTNPADRATVEAKMTAVLRILRSRGAEKIVLGAWGCGAYGNPVGEIARAWRKVLLGADSQQVGAKRRGHCVEQWDGFEEVVFAIRERRMAGVFEEAWGKGLVVEELWKGNGGDAVEEDEGGEEGVTGGGREMSELERKIEEMEIQVQRVLNPGLKSRLEDVLEGLRRDLGKATICSATAEIGEMEPAELSRHQD